MHGKDIKDPDEKYQKFSNRPDAAVLSYPVITSGKYAHRDSFVALLGKNPTKKELEYMSLEKHVTKEMPPCFIWQTATDGTVPVQNSYWKYHSMAEALMVLHPVDLLYIQEQTRCNLPDKIP